VRSRSQSKDEQLGVRIPHAGEGSPPVVPLRELAFLITRDLLAIPD
jgi:hypothetical protein